MKNSELQKQPEPKCVRILTLLELLSNKIIYYFFNIKLDARGAYCPRKLTETNWPDLYTSTDYTSTGDSLTTVKEFGPNQNSELYKNSL